MKKLMVTTALALGLGVAGAAHADGVNVGTLTCDEEGGWGLILGSNRAVHCTFESGDKSERYDGSITKVGDFYERAMAIDGFEARLAFTNRGQGWVVRKLREILPGVAAPALRQTLQAMLDAHVDNIDAANRALDQQAR